MSIQIQGIKTAIYHRENDFNIFLEKSLHGYDLEGKVLAITSKIISLAEGQLVAANSISKHDLVQKEADQYLGAGGYGVELTIKHGIMIPSAGIDESNDQKPLALITGAQVEFTENSSAAEIAIQPENDLYLPILSKPAKTEQLHYLMQSINMSGFDF